MTTTAVPISALAPRPPRPRLQLDLTKNNQSAKSSKKTKWTILCVGLTLLTMCVTLVGTMLSIGSQYEQKLVARKWDHPETRNKTFGGHLSQISHITVSTSNVRKNIDSTTMSPLFARLKEISNENSLPKENQNKNHNMRIIQNAVNRDSDGKNTFGYRGKILRSLGETFSSDGILTTRTLHQSGYKRKTS